MSVLNRVPDRRTSKRLTNPHGRRSCERFVLCDSLDAVLRTDLGNQAGADILDISSTGMFAISCSSSFQPSIGEILQIIFFSDNTSKSIAITGSIRYVSFEERELINYVGFGVEFSESLGTNLRIIDDVSVSFFGDEFIIAGKESVAAAC